jgi:hypothetical protein
MKEMHAPHRDRLFDQRRAGVMLNEVKHLGACPELLGKHEILARGSG